VEGNVWATVVTVDGSTCGPEVGTTSVGSTLGLEVGATSLELGRILAVVVVAWVVGVVDDDVELELEELLDDELLDDELELELLDDELLEDELDEELLDGLTCSARAWAPAGSCEVARAPRLSSPPRAVTASPVFALVFTGCSLWSRRPCRSRSGATTPRGH
jgi:hypothetical protein